jgi:tryptophan-rich sensory protein
MKINNIKSLIIFLIINFGALGLGGLFTNSGVSSDWYQNINKAPWTPPGWVFGAAWTTIMILFSIYMAFAFKDFNKSKSLMILFGIQVILNILWNPLFFHFKWTGIALIEIIMLLLVVTYIFKTFYSELGYKSFLLLPYIMWLVIASSLNAYIFLKN